MKRRKAIAALAFTPTAAIAQSGAPGWSDGFARSWLDSFKEHWRDSKEYTLAVLDAMPPDNFDTKPNPVQRTFGDQLRHLAFANVIYFNAFGLIPVPQATLTTDSKSIDKYASELDKAAVRKFVGASFDYVSAVLDKMTQRDLIRKDVPLFRGVPPHSGTDICLRAYMHTAHHRGQAVVYLRVKGITPPTWKFEPHGM
jgi:uncharacterized damage-inducible protein DinB